MMERGGRGRDGRRCRCRGTAGKAGGRVGSIVPANADAAAAASVGPRGEPHGGSGCVGGSRTWSPSVKSCGSRGGSGSSSASRRDGGVQCAVHAGLPLHQTATAAATGTTIANVLVRRMPLMSGGAVFGTGGKATQFVVLIEGTYALLPNEGRLVVGIATAGSAGPVSTVQFGRTSIRPTAVDPPTTSGRAGGRGRRRPRRRGRSRCGVPFKIVGGHVCLFCFMCCLCARSNPNQEQRQSTKDANGCLDGIGAGKSFFSLSRCSIQ